MTDVPGPTRTLTLLFTDGTTGSADVAVGAGRFASLRVDQLDAILGRTAPTAFSIRVDSRTPVVSSFVHYDLYLGGGWGTLGQPIGLTNDVALM